MNLKRKQIALTILTIALILGCIISMVQESQASEKAVIANYPQLEATYTTQLRAMLEQAGYRNSGISLTKKYTEDGGRDYTVQVHHHRISRSSEDVQVALLNDLRSINFPAENCTMNVEILIVDADFQN